MPASPNIYDESYEANADLSAKQYYAVEDVATDKVDVCNNAGDKVCGVLQNKPTAGRAALVRHHGRTKAVVDGSGTAIVYGDWLGTGATGKFVKKTANNDIVFLQALGASTADGDIIDARIVGPFYLGA